jgi:hypothetical protein
MVLEGWRIIRKEGCSGDRSPTIDLLERPGVRIIRPIGEGYEFRHDQMHAFLAASWIVHEAPNVTAIAERLDKSEIWQASRQDQEEVWRFLAALIDPLPGVLELLAVRSGGA